MQTYLGITEEDELAVIGAITRTLSLDKSIKSGRPYSMQLLSSETDGQLMCYNNLISFLRPECICIYNTCGACEYTISIREVNARLNRTDQIEENNEETTVRLCDFYYYRLTVAFVQTRLFVCIELIGEGSWQIIHSRSDQLATFFALSTMSSASIVHYVMTHDFLYFEWFDFEKRQTIGGTMDRLRQPSSVVQMVSSGSNVYTLLAYNNFFETRTIRLGESGLEYEPKEKYRSCPFIYPDGKDGLTVLAPTYVGNPIIFQPYDHKPGFPWLSRAYFKIADNDIPQNPVYKDSTGAREIEGARISNQAGIVYAVEDTSRHYGCSLFFANFDARCEPWTSLSGRQKGRFSFE